MLLLRSLLFMAHDFLNLIAKALQSMNWKARVQRKNAIVIIKSTEIQLYFGNVVIQSPLVFQVGRSPLKVNWTNYRKKWPGGPRNRNSERNGKRNQRLLKDLTLIPADIWTWMNYRIRVIVRIRLQVMGTERKGKK